MGDGFRKLGWAALLLLAMLALVPSGAAAAAKRTRCRGRVLEGLTGSQPPAELEGSLEAPVLAQYAIFRRAQLPSDMLPPVNPAADAIGNSLSSYYPSEIRRLAALPSGARFYVVPGLPHAIKVLRPGCVPKPLLELVEKERAKAAEPRYCIVATGLAQDALGGACTSFGDAAGSTPIFELFGAEEATALLVPDGVASVRIVGPRSHTQTIAVSENAYVYAPPADLAKEESSLFEKLFKAPKAKHVTKARAHRLEKRLVRALEQIVARTRPERVEWLGPAGQVLKTTKRPPGIGGGSALGGLIVAALLSSG